MDSELVSLILAALFLVTTTLYIWNKLSKSNIHYFKVINIVKYVICCILLILNYKYMHDYFKTVSSTLIMMLYHYSLYKDNDEIKEIIIRPIYSQLIVLVSELIYISIIILISQVNSMDLTEQYFGSIITNLIIAIICVFISQFKFVLKIYNKIISITDKIKSYRLLILSVLLIVIANILTSLVYYKISLIFLLIANTMVIVIYTIFIFLYLRTNNNYIDVNDKYKMTLNSLKEYEDILSKYRISNHENKNQLLTIRGMIKNKKVVSYIDEIIENKNRDNEKLMIESLVIPEGGLRGLIYSKMLLMKENNIAYDLCIDKKIKTTYLTSLSDNLNLSICNIVGVYLDNAIEAVKNLEEKYIVIEMYLDDNSLNIAITNNYEGNIDMERIDNAGYSTKGDNHGYGLSLVKNILAQNKNISSIRRISEDEFTQEIKIKNCNN